MPAAAISFAFGQRLAPIVDDKKKSATGRTATKGMMMQSWHGEYGCVRPNRAVGFIQQALKALKPLNSLPASVPGSVVPERRANMAQSEDYMARTVWAPSTTA
jgi:hypothetical protein